MPHGFGLIVTEKPDEALVINYENEEDAPCQLLYADDRWPDCRCRSCFDEATRVWKQQQAAPPPSRTDRALIDSRPYRDKFPGEYLVISRSGLLYHGYDAQEARRILHEANQQVRGSVLLVDPTLRQSILRGRSISPPQKGSTVDNISARIGAIETLLGLSPADVPELPAKALARIQYVRAQGHPATEPTVIRGPFREAVQDGRVWAYYYRAADVLDRPAVGTKPVLMLFWGPEADQMTTLSLWSLPNGAAPPSTLWFPGNQIEALISGLVPLLLQSFGCRILSPEGEEHVVATLRAVGTPQATQEWLETLQKSLEKAKSEACGQ